MRAVLITTILAIAAGTAAAADTPDTKGRAVALYVEQSNPGETRDAFVLRIAPKAVSYTNRTSHQVCGAVVTRPDGLFQIDVATIKNGLRCEVPSETEVYFVTHVWSYKTFSASEREIPGYMATRNTLYFQDGRKEKKVGKLGFW